MKKAFLIILFVCFGFNISSQEYFFYHFKDKKTLNRVYQYIPVKFNSNIPLIESSNIIENVLGNEVESKSVVKYSYQNGENSNIVLVKIKGGMSENAVNSAAERLTKFP